MNELINRVIMRLRRGWCTHALARTDLGGVTYPGATNAVSWCVSGAICAETTEREDAEIGQKLRDLIRYKIKSAWVSEWNDEQATVDPIIAVLESCKECSQPSI